jgi:hypothetical protein
MKLIALEIPDDATDLANWLESHLVGLDLSTLVAQLNVVHGFNQRRQNLGPDSSSISVETILGKQRDAVLSRGLGALPPDRLRPLLHHPRLLLDLQELILISGGSYWRRREESAADSAQKVAIDRGWDWVKANVLDAPPSVSPIRAVAANKPRPTWYWKAKAGLAAAAAAAFVGVTIYRWPPGGPNGNANRQAGPIVASSAGWGWNRPEALSQDLSSKAYLIRLANVAHEWFNQRPDNSADLAERISEFRQGCSTLIQSPHRPLSVADRTWLVDKCAAWSAKLDGHLVALKSGQDLIKVRDEVDETINHLVATLRERADGLA